MLVRNRGRCGGHRDGVWQRDLDGGHDLRGPVGGRGGDKVDEVRGEHLARVHAHARWRVHAGG